MSLSFKYWVEFDDEGGIKSLHKSKYDCPAQCDEYVVKLIPIERDKTEELRKAAESSADALIRDTKELGVRMRKFKTELDRTLRTAKRIKI